MMNNKSSNENIDIIYNAVRMSCACLQLTNNILLTMCPPPLVQPLCSVLLCRYTNTCNYYNHMQHTGANYNHTQQS